MQSGQEMLEQARRIAGTRQVRFGANATIMTIAFIGILVLINIIAARNLVQWDLTEEGTFSLSPETIEIITQLRQPVEIIGFFVPQDQITREDAESRLREYASRTDQISYRIVDPNASPGVAREYEVVSNGTLVFVSGERREQTLTSDEQAITAALVQVTKETFPTVSFLTGHGERAIDDFDPGGYSTAASILRDDSFGVEPINLVLTDTLAPANRVLVIADPQRAFQEQEKATIARYLARGGRLLLLGNPLSPAPLPELMAAIGLSWNDDLLLDQRSELGNAAAPALDSTHYGPSPVTNDLDGPSIFLTARTISRVGDTAPTGLTLTPFLSSSPNSQAVTDFTPEGEVRPAPDDAVGPLDFGYTVEGTINATALLTDTTIPTATTAARIVVIGDADFASNAYMNALALVNADFFRSAIAWLAAQEDDFTLPPRPQPVDRTVFLNDQQSQLVFFGSTIGLPVLVIVAGVLVWWQQR